MKGTYFKKGNQRSYSLGKYQKKKFEDGVLVRFKITLPGGWIPSVIYFGINLACL